MIKTWYWNYGRCLFSSLYISIFYSVNVVNSLLEKKNSLNKKEEVVDFPQFLEREALYFFELLNACFSPQLKGCNRWWVLCWWTENYITVFCICLDSKDSQGIYKHIVRNLGIWGFIFYLRDYWWYIYIYKRMDHFRFINVLLSLI